MSLALIGSLKTTDWKDWTIPTLTDDQPENWVPKP